MEGTAPGERGQDGVRPGPARSARGSDEEEPGSGGGAAAAAAAAPHRPQMPPPSLIGEERRREGGEGGDLACSRCPNAKPSQPRSGCRAPRPAAGPRLRLAQGSAELPAAVSPGAPQLFVYGLAAAPGCAGLELPGTARCGPWGHPLCWAAQLLRRTTGFGESRNEKSKSTRRSGATGTRGRCGLQAFFRL